MRGSRSDPRAEDTAEGVLWALTVDELRRLAKVFRQPPPNRKHDLVLAILSELGDGRLEVHYGRLGDLEKAAVAEAVHDPEGKHRADRFQAKYGGEPPGRSLPTYRNREEAGPLSLFFCGTDRIPADLKLRLLAFVPAPVEDRVKAEGEPPAVFDLEVSGWDRSTREYLRTTRGVPVVRRENERSALHDVVAVLRLVDAGKLTVGDTTRRPTAAAARAVASVLQGGDFYEENARGTEDRRIAGGKDPGRLEGVEAGRGSGAPATTEGGSESVAEGRNDTDSRSSLERRDRREPVGPIKAYAWPIIVQAGGLAKPLGTRLMLTKKGTELLGRPAVEAIRAAWDGWEVDSRFDEFLRIEAIKGQTGRGRRGMTAVDQRRTAVTSALAACPPGEWVSVDEFFRSIRASEDDFEVTRDESGLYIADPQYGSLGYRGYAEWSLLQGRYVLCVLFEYAATLGAIDVAYVPPAGVRRDYRGNWGTDDLEFLSRYDGLLSFRVTPLGAHLLDLTDEFTPAALPAAAVLRVLPNCDIVASGETPSPADLLMLEALGRRVSDVVWRLDEAKLLAAVEAGHPVTEARQFLAARDGGSLPANVSQLLDDIEARSARIRESGRARLYECADPALATLIANDSRTRRHCLLAGERHLVAPEGSVRAFRRGLRELGYAISPQSCEIKSEA